MTLGDLLTNVEPSESTPIRCEYRNGVEPDNQEVQEYLRQLGGVPLKLQEIIADDGAYFVFFKGPIIDNPELAPMKGKRPKNWLKGSTWDNVWGAHDPNSRAILIGIDGDYRGVRSIRHEFGHSFDEVIGEYISEGGLLRKLLNWWTRGKHLCLSNRKDILQAVKMEPFSNEYFQDPEEYVANSVDLFYGTLETKRQLESNNPTMFQLLSSINADHRS